MDIVTDSVERFDVFLASVADDGVIVLHELYHFRDCFGWIGSIAVDED